MASEGAGVSNPGASLPASGNSRPNAGRSRGSRIDLSAVGSLGRAIHQDRYGRLPKGEARARTRRCTRRLPVLPLSRSDPLPAVGRNRRVLGTGRRGSGPYDGCALCTDNRSPLECQLTHRSNGRRFAPPLIAIALCGLCDEAVPDEAASRRLQEGVELVLVDRIKVRGSPRGLDLCVWIDHRATREGDSLGRPPLMWTHRITGRSNGRLASLAAVDRHRVIFARPHE